MVKGRVRWFNVNKGYGFIKPEKGREDVFVHISSLQSSKIMELNENDNICYDLAEERGRSHAVNLRKL